MKKTISLIAGAILSILCGGILFTGCGGGSSTNSNTQENAIENPSGNGNYTYTTLMEDYSKIKEIGSFKISNYNEVSEMIFNPNDTKAFISDQIDLYVYDISNLKNPKQLKKYSGLYSGGRNIALSKDNKKLFIDKLSSLLVLDVSNPEEEIKELGAYENNNTIVDFVLSNDGKTIFLTDNSSLKIIDVSDPTFPTTTKDIPNIKKLFISNDDKRLYCLVKDEQEEGLIILDLTDRTNPTQKGKFTVNEIVSDMEVSKDGKVAILKTNQGIVILNINRSNDNNLDNIIEALLYPNYYKFDDIKIASNNKIVFGVRKLGLKVDILDISNPQNPEKINSIDFGYTYNTPYKVFLSNDEEKMFVTTTISAEGSESPAFGKTRVYMFDVSSYTQ